MDSFLLLYGFQTTLFTLALASLGTMVLMGVWIGGHAGKVLKNAVVGAQEGPHAMVADITRHLERLGWWQRLGAVVYGSVITVVFGILVVAFLQSDFRYVLVAAHSSSYQPWSYRLGAVWGNHEGSLLLWNWFLSLLLVGMTRCTLMIRPGPQGGDGDALTSHGTDGERAVALLQKTLRSTVMAAVCCGFLVYMLLGSDPFVMQRLPSQGLSFEGRGLTPLLLDPLLVLHPPILFLGYALTAHPYGTLLARSLTFLLLAPRGCSSATPRGVDRLASHLTHMPTRSLEVGALGALAMLTLGIGLGSYWAYYELGWGGYWFWDPVENASLLPWVAMLILIHTIKVAEGSHSIPLTPLVITAGVMGFLLSILGTFLVRSGVVSSVHAFAIDPTRGWMVTALITTIVLPTLVIGVAYALRWRRLCRDAWCPVTITDARARGGLVLGLIAMTVAGATILWGTVYPLGAQHIFGTSVSVGPPYFERTLAPLVLVGSLCFYFLMGRWGSFPQHCRRLVACWYARGRLLVAVVVGGALVLVGAWTTLGSTVVELGVMGVMCLAAGVLFLLGALTVMVRWLVKGESSPTRGLAISLSHGGFGLMLVAMALDAGGQVTRTLTLDAPGVGRSAMAVAAKDPGNDEEEGAWKESMASLHPESATLAGYALGLGGYNLIPTDGYTALESKVWVCQLPSCKTVGILRPQWRLYRNFDQLIYKTHQYRVGWFSQLYAVIKSAREDRLVVKVSYRPYILLIWLGALAMVVGMGIGILGRLGKGGWMGGGEQLRHQSRHNFTRGAAGFFLWMVLASWTSPAVAQEHQHDGTPPMSQELEQRATRLFRLIRCPTCTFQTIEDSPSPAAHDLQLRINKGLQEGQTDDEIIEELVRQYGATILLEPGYSRATLSLWLGPILLFFLLVLWYKRKRK